jgi:amino acid adenylation domain-containing protein
VTPGPPDLALRRSQLTPERRAILERWLQGRDRTDRQGISRRAGGGPAPLSFAQERMWLLEQLMGGDATYSTLPSATWLRGPLDAALVARSFAEVVRRHESLRTTFEMSAGEPRQVVAPSLSLPVPVVDLRDRPDPEAEAMRLARSAGHSPFDLARGPLIQASLLRLADEVHVLLLVMHHIICDGWSDTVLVRDLAATYSALAAGRPSPLEPLPIQYPDYARWQRDRLRGPALERLLAYWRDRLAGAPPLELPTDRPRPPVQGLRGASLRLEVPAVTAARLRALGRQRRATLFMTLLAAVAVLLQRWSGQEDVVVGTPVANRARAETEGLIGCFVNTLALRVDLSGDPTFLELLDRVRDLAVEAYAHQELPFERVVDEVQRVRDLSRSPLFQVMFALQDAPRSDLEFGGVRVTPVELDHWVAKYDVDIEAREWQGTLHVRIRYDADLFDAGTRERITGHLQTLVAGVAAHPDRRLSELPLLSDAERHRLLREWNETAREYPVVPAHELVLAQVAARPDAIAVTAPDGSLAYGDLGLRASRLARALRDLGVGPDTRVGLCVGRSRDLVTGILGILMAGGAYVPLDPAYPEERLAYMLADSGAPVVVAQAHLLAVLPADRPRVLLLDELDAPGPGVPEPADGARAIHPDNLAYVIYTSGSTGRPKGVMISHRSLSNFAQANGEYVGAGPDDVMLQFATPCFDVSVLEIFTALTTGARLAVPERETLVSPSELTAFMRREAVTIVDIPPAVVELLPAEAFPALRVQLIGGESFSGALATRWQAPGRRVINGYGPTEATVMMTVEECRGAYEQMPPIGRPMANHQVYVLDSGMRPVPVGVPRELYLGGAGLARGYLGRPDLTAERFLPDPFGPEPGARLYRTGDVARFLPDGGLEFLGRVDHQVKLRGHRIELGEVEAVLTQHPSVRQAVAVLAGPGGAARRLVAYVQPEPGAAPDGAELRTWLGRRLPGHMVPSAIVALDRLPLTPSGKVDRAALPAVEEGLLERARAGIPPRTEMERALVEEVFAPVLGVERVGVEDSFFELGGSSLQLAQVQHRIREVMGVELPLRVLFQGPTIAELAVHLEGLEPERGREPSDDAAGEREEGEI